MGNVFYIVQLDYMNVSSFNLGVKLSEATKYGLDNLIAKMNYSNSKPVAIFKVKLK